MHQNVIGIFSFMMFFGWVSDKWPGLYTYAGLYFFIGISHIIAVLLVKTITDRPPKIASFVSGSDSKDESLKYSSFPFWCYISFYTLWAAGRSALLTFAAAYLLDVLQYSVTKTMMIFALQQVVSAIVLLVMGKFTDKTGHRLPLIFVSGFVALSMSLWSFSAWMGGVAIVIYQIINGIAGHGHSMLALNFGLEIFPAKGRSGYLAFSRIMIGGGAIIAPILAGVFMTSLDSWKTIVSGATMSNYHLLFVICSFVTFLSIVPLILVGNRTISDS